MSIIGTLCGVGFLYLLKCLWRKFKKSKRGKKMMLRVYKKDSDNDEDDNSDDPEAARFERIRDRIRRQELQKYDIWNYRGEGLMPEMLNDARPQRFEHVVDLWDIHNAEGISLDSMDTDTCTIVAEADTTSSLSDDEIDVVTEKLKELRC